MLRKTRKKNPLPFPFSKRSHVGNLRQIRKQGKGRSSKRKGNRRCPFLFAPAAGAAVSRAPQSATPAEPQRKTPRPLGANPLTQFACPAQPEQKRSRPSGANSLTQFACPGQPVLKRSRPSGANSLTQFACPRGSVPENKVYPLTNPNLTAIILKLIYKCHEKEEYFSFARLERVRSVQAPRRGRRRSLWSRTAEFLLSCSV